MEPADIVAEVLNVYVIGRQEQVEAILMVDL